MRYQVIVFPTLSGLDVRLIPVRPSDGLQAGGLPLFAARWVEETVRAAGPGAGRPGLVGWWRRRRLWGLVRRGLERLGLRGYEAYVRTAPASPAQGGRLGDEPALPDPTLEAACGALLRLMAGRVLLESELVRLADRAGLPEEAARAASEHLAATGRMVRTAAVEVGRAGARCLRCGSGDGIVADVCGLCGSWACPRCIRCAAMGVARGCVALYAAPGYEEEGGGGSARARGALEADAVAREARSRADEPGEEPGVWRLDPSLVEALAPAQRQAFEAVRSLVATRLDGKGRAGASPGGCLVWAVTGAGKTEVAFGAAEVVLQQGGSVLLCVPRRDVAADVARRARRAFGGGSVRLLTGNGRGRSADRLAPWPVCGELVVSTTHQALRFYRAFRLVVVDEVDAFPYRGSAMLQHGVERAGRPDGFTVVMSATPGRVWLERAKAAGWPVITIPVRHHGHPLPVPLIWVHRSMTAWQAQPADPRRVPPAIRRWMDRRSAGSGVLVFVPTVPLAEAVGSALGLPFCHSRDPLRDEKVAALARGRVPGLVTTTLLERGLTFERVDVAVLFADFDAVFDEAALVQMAGRAGRSARHPTGRVLFAAARVSGAMRAAAAAIEAMNRRAAEMGLLAH